MVYKLTDISHLEKMSEIKDKTPVIQEVKLFDGQIETSSLDNTILSLCTKLRGEGFAKYADGLEDKFIKYKLVAKASKKHLYNTHDESGEDLVNSAHPDGDISIGEASDNNGLVQNNINRHKRIVDIVSKEPTGKLAVAACKIVLADFLDSSSSSQETRKLQDKFGVFVTNLLPDLNAVVVALTDFQDVKLSNGKSVSDYNVMTMPEVFSSFIRSGQWATDDGAKRIINASDIMFKRLYDLISQIDKTIDKGTNAFPNKNFPEAAYARLNTHRENFLSLYADFNKDSGAAQWHGQFISPDALSTSITSLNEKLNSIVARIDRHIIAEPAFQKLPKFLTWANGAKEYVKNVENELIALVGKARANVDEMSKVHQGQNALIDANKLKQFLQELKSPEIKIDETTNDANVFVKSLDKIYTDTLSAIINAINATPIDNNLKQTIMEHFSSE
jgi:hypothetical protein